ncbi:hypothetical protein ACFXPA_05745 [Amycolatopsis sp. NPDC059090]|uniref:hypothetical protein n=1 Tax=unclassified Amycolatopsis TaxID=2618356 RepID=UPI00366E5C02
MRLNACHAQRAREPPHRLSAADDVRPAHDELAETTGKAQAVVALAGRLCLANTAIRRHFPDTAAELAQQRAVAPGAPGAANIRCLILESFGSPIRLSCAGYEVSSAKLSAATVG